MTLRYLIYISLLLSNTVLAGNAQQTKIDSVLQALLNYLTAAPARIIAVLAIVAVGYGTLHLGRMPKQRAISVVVGIGIIFGGAAILQMLGLGQG
jgi:type IV secretory pathway VirB2 component (pilin)